MGVCAHLVDTSDGQCKELSWGDGSFWHITGQEAWNWKHDVCSAPNPGDGWCICMWATARLIESAGCDNVHIDCAATDTAYVMSKPQLHGTAQAVERNNTHVYM